MHTPTIELADRIPPRGFGRKARALRDPERNYEPPCRRMRLTPAERAARRHDRGDRPMAA